MLTKLLEDHTKIMAMYSQGTTPLPVQSTPHLISHHPYSSYEPHVSIVDNAFFVNFSLQPIIHKAHSKCPFSFQAAPQPINQPSNPKGKPSRHKISKDKARQDLIPFTYTELFPKLLEAHLLAPVYTPTFQPPFKKWHDCKARCDYHAGSPSHSTENCHEFFKEFE